MKKLFLTLGAATTVIAPLAAVVSCGNKQTENAETNKQDIKISTQQQNVWDGVTEGKDYVEGEFTEEYTPHGLIHDGQTPTKPAHASDFNIEEDGLYLVAKDYHGQLWNSHKLVDGEKITDNISPINSIRGVGVMREVVQFGDGDSFYAMYNEDDTDGLSVDNLLSTFGFRDTSIMVNPTIAKINEGFGVKKAGMWGVTIPLKAADATHGALGNYVGSQNNHVGYGGYATKTEFQAAVKRFVAIYGIDHEVVTSIFNYYGLSKTLDANGDYMDSESTAGHASRGFAPVVQLDPVLTYEIIDHRTVKFTWHIKEFKATGATFVFNGRQFGTLSVGDKNEWDAYLRHDYATYKGVRPEYIQNVEHTSQAN